MDYSCGYCGFTLNSKESLRCIACGHKPWYQYIPYNYSNELESLIEFSDIKKSIKLLERETHNFGEE